MTRYILDTNTVGYLLKGNDGVMARIRSVPMSAVHISAITSAELHFGLARRPGAVHLRAAVHEFLKRTTVLAWGEAVSQAYGRLRATLESAGKGLSPLDTLIASHALHEKATLITTDRAFSQVPELLVEDWRD